jgi:hypothetical protein
MAYVFEAWLISLALLVVGGWSAVLVAFISTRRITLDTPLLRRPLRQGGPPYLLPDGWADQTRQR